jgi:hypothetical protein
MVKIPFIYGTAAIGLEPLQGRAEPLTALCVLERGMASNAGVVARTMLAG